MKTVTLNSPCTTGPVRVAQLRPARAHTPQRHPVGARQLADSPDHSAYFDQLDDPAAATDGPHAANAGPRVLHVDADPATVRVLATLVAPEAQVTHAATLADARRLLTSQVFSLVVLDPALPDGDARSLLPMLAGTPLLVYSATQPEWRGASPAYLSKPWTSARQLWVAIAGMLGLQASLAAGD